MYELLYTSLAIKNFSDSELKELLEQARVKNDRLGITGMMMYDDREIIQLLEGEKEVVKELYETIQSDPRHTIVEVFYEGLIESRAFKDWSMAFKMIDDDTRQLVLSGYEQLDYEGSPINLIKDNPPNRGKSMFLILRKML